MNCLAMETNHQCAALTNFLHPRSQLDSCQRKMMKRKMNATKMKTAPNASTAQLMPALSVHATWVNGLMSKHALHALKKKKEMNELRRKANANGFVNVLLSAHQTTPSKPSPAGHLGKAGQLGTVRPAASSKHDPVWLASQQGAVQRREIPHSCRRLPSISF